MCLFLCHYYTVLITIVLQYTLKSGQLIHLALLFLKIVLDLVDVFSQLSLELSLYSAQHIFPEESRGAMEGGREGERERGRIEGRKERKHKEGKIGGWEEEKNYSRQHITAVVDNFSSKRSESKYFKLCEPYGFCSNYLTLSL